MQEFAVQQWPVGFQDSNRYQCLDNISMQTDLSGFLEEFHFLRSTLTINSRLNCPKSLTINAASVPQLVSIYRDNQGEEEARQQCLTQRAYRAVKFIASLTPMDQDIQIPQRQTRLVRPKVSEKRTLSRGTLKTERLQPKRQPIQQSVQAFDEKSVSNYQLSSNSENSAVSPVYTGSVSYRSGEMLGNNQGLSEGTSQSQDTLPHVENIQITRQQLVVCISTPIVDRSSTLQQTQRVAIRQFSPEFMVSESASYNLPQQTPVSVERPVSHKETQTTHLHSSPIGVSNRKSNFNISSDLINIHEVLERKRSSRSKDQQRQKHINEFNCRVEEDLNSIKEQLQFIRNTQKDISLSQAQSRVTTRVHNTNNDHYQRPKQVRVLRFDLSQNSSTPKPVKQLLTLSRSINIRAEASRPSTASKSRPKAVDKSLNGRLSNERRREEKSIDNLQRSIQLSRPRPKELLTTRIAKYS